MVKRAGEMPQEKTDPVFIHPGSTSTKLAFSGQA